MSSGTARLGFFSLERTVKEKRPR